jgi:hypothetical protein
MHWSLAELREMDADEYHELVEWAKENGKKDDPDSMDIDAVIDAKKAKEAAE